MASNILPQIVGAIDAPVVSPKTSTVKIQPDAIIDCHGSRDGQPCPKRRERIKI
jgi:hypothetical protein